MGQSRHSDKLALVADIDPNEFNVANKLLKLDATAEIPEAQMNDSVFFLVKKLTPALFRTNAATGTLSQGSSRINNNLIETAGDCCYADVVNEYAAIDFGDLRYITQFRMYGDGDTIMGDGRWKIQHWDGAAWLDNTVNIPLRRETSWSDWISLSSPIITSKIRFIATVIDTQSNKSPISELEMKG